MCISLKEKDYSNNYPAGICFDLNCHIVPFYYKKFPQIHLKALFYTNIDWS